MSPLRAEAVLFDKDGTLFDFDATWIAWVEVMLAKWSGGDAGLAARLAEVLGFDRGARAFAPDSLVVSHTTREIATAVAPLVGMAPELVIERIDAEAAVVPMREAVPLVPLLAGLTAAGLRIGVATNDSEVPARRHLASVGIEAMFDFIAGADSGYGGKPEPGMLLAFAGSTGVAPGRIVMVGDSRHDLSAGRAAGMQTVGVLTGLADAAALAPLADAILPDIGHLPGWLSGGA